MSQVQEIKDKLDIVDIVGSRITLQRSGKNFRAVCPFHGEKTPSFFVSPDLQTFKCFGCARQGDVFTFIQEFDRLTFPEALEYLAKEAQVELKQEFNDPQEKQRRRIFEALDLAGQFYSYVLEKHKAGEAGRQYLKTRQLSASLQKRFGLGVAAESWDQLTKFLLKKKFTATEIVDCGLGIKGKRGTYDRFRGRLMFPLHDHRGRIVGFSGRLLSQDAKEAKYINTPETTVYHKRYLLYGYSQNLDAIREKKAVIVMEGEFDMLSSVQAHVNHVVAVKGSALTVEQVRILARTVQTIYLALDADAAGVEATKRAIEVVQGFPVALRIIPLAGGKDPDEMARQDPKGWREQVDQHVSAFEYVLDHTVKKYDIKTMEGQKSAVDELLELVRRIEHPVERSFYLKSLAEKFSISQSVLEENLERLQKKAVMPRQSRDAAESDEQKQTDKLYPQEEYLWQLIMQTTSRDWLQPIKPELFQSTLYQRLSLELQGFLAKHENFTLKAFSQSLPAELQQALTQVYLAELPLEGEAVETEIETVLGQLRQQRARSRLKEISQELAQLEQSGMASSESAEYKELEAEFSRWTKALQNRE